MMKHKKEIIGKSGGDESPPQVFRQEMLDRAFLTQRAPKRVATTTAPTAAAARNAAWMPV
jgi:hypothetical protein